MSEKIKFHLDENVTNAVANGLRQRGIDVTTTHESGLISTSDEVQLGFALSEGRVIFTQDRDFLRLHYADVKHAGIAYSIKGRRSTGQILSGLILIWEVLTPEEMRNKLEFI